MVGPAGLVAACSILSMAVLGGIIYHNTNTLNSYRTAEDSDRWTADKEKALLTFERVVQPKITDVVMDVAIFPADSRVVTQGRYTLENRSGESLSEVHVNLARDLKATQLEVDGATLDQKMDLFNYRIFHFTQPLAPGARTTLRFATVREQRGFRNSGNDTRVVDNGTFIDNMEIAPVLGVNREEFLSDRIKRRKFGLVPELRPAKLEDDSARDFNMLRRDSDWVNADLTVSTDSSQLVIAPGYLESERVEGKRRIARYRTDAPILNFFSIQSARYVVARDRWKNVDLAVYHDAAHDHNTALMIEAMKRSLDCFTESFGPFQFHQLRILEFPAYASFAQSFANTIPYSESIGFILDRKDPDDIDMVSYVTAHEIGHQWWAHQLVSADQQGATFLVESMAQYSALLVMERLYGPAQIRKFLKLEMDRYLRARGGERLEELPLMRVENQPYIHYQKGGLALYLLKEELGEAAVNGVLQQLLKQYAFKLAPFANPRDFLSLLRQRAGAEHETLIADLFERITLHDLKAVKAVSRHLSDGQWETTIHVSARKLYADGTGKETAIPFREEFEIGLFSIEPGKKGFTTDSVISMRRQAVHDGEQDIVFHSAKEPAYAGVDPYNKHIDRNTDDNVVAVTASP
jgi:aminopeptidase N